MGDSEAGEKGEKGEKGENHKQSLGPHLNAYANWQSIYVLKV
jgi:hypothetical protein